MQLIVDNLSVVRGSRTVIRDLSVVVPSASALILRGANGAGKTTLLRAIAGFLAPSSGEITLRRDDRLDAPMIDGEVAEYCHYIGHANGIRTALTVSENVAFWAQYLAEGPLHQTNVVSVDPVELVADALRAFNLQDLADIPAGYLSAGQTRRLGLARLVAAPRSIWLMDEPTVSLDAASVELLSGVVEKHVADGGLVIAATHIPLGLANAKELELQPVPYAIATADEEMML